MPRGRRIQEPGSTYHVIQTAVAEAPIFREPAAVEFYLARLASTARREGVVVLAYAIMDTHVHLVLWVPGSLSKFMLSLATSFAAYYNKRHGRRGRVFGRVYWSKVIESELQLRLTIRYVLLNPAKAGLMSRFTELERSSRTSYPSLIGRSNLFANDALVALRHFGADPEAARAALRSWLEEGNQGFDPAKYEDTDETANDHRRDSAALRNHLREEASREALVTAGWSVEAVGELVCRRLRVSVALVRSRARNEAASNARSAIGHLARMELGRPLTEIAEWLGVTPSAVHQALSRGREVVARHALALTIDQDVAENDTSSGERL